MKNNKKAYLAPMVEVMNARVEKGFAGSGNVAPGPNVGPFTPVNPKGFLPMGTTVDFD